MMDCINRSSNRILELGSTALRLLSSSPQGRVLAAIRNAIYLRTEGGELFWMVSETCPMHQRCVKISPSLPELESGSLYVVNDHNLVLNTGVTLDFHLIPAWTPPALSQKNVIPIGILPESVTILYRTILDQHTLTGFGTLIPAILKFSWQEEAALYCADSTLAVDKALPLLDAIARASRTHNLHSMTPYFSSLVGLGEGLTPSGDDFLGGLLFCWRLLYSAYPQTSFLDDNYSALINSSNSRTNLISLTLLRDHSNGCSIESMHHFGNALLMGQPVGKLLTIANTIIAVGHSTGWDLLTGFLIGMLLTFPFSTSIDAASVLNTLWV